MIDKFAPIIPYCGMGGIKLYSTTCDLAETLRGAILAFSEPFLRYDCEDILSLYFLPYNQKLFRISTLPGYKGPLYGEITTASTEADLLKLDSSLAYDPFEEIFESPKGFFIETNPITKKADRISIFIKELDTKAFWIGNW